MEFTKLFHIFAASLVLALASGLWSSEPKSGFVGDLIYEKDVFERLSLWTTNFANSSISHYRQMTTRRLRLVRFYILNYIVRAGVGYLRCLSCVGRAMRRPVVPGWAKKQTPTPFLYHMLTYKNMFNCLIWGVCRLRIKYYYVYQLY